MQRKTAENTDPCAVSPRRGREHSAGSPRRRGCEKASFQSRGNPVSQPESHISLAVYNVFFCVQDRKRVLREMHASNSLSGTGFPLVKSITSWLLANLCRVISDY